MPMGKGTYGKKRGRPKKKMKIKIDKFKNFKKKHKNHPNLTMPVSTSTNLKVNKIVKLKKYKMA